MMQISETEVFKACRILFGSGLQFNRNFLQYLQPAGAHSAFRKQAKNTHPDSQRKGDAKISPAAHLFQDLNQAHQLIQNYLRQRDLAARKHSAAAARPSTSGSVPRSAQMKPQGPLPTRPLQFGLFLYYRGLIPFKALISGLIWQRQQRPAIGQIAQRWGWLNELEIKQVLNCRDIGTFGERAEQLGLLSSIQVRAILLHQRSRQGKLGDFFVEQGLLSSTQIRQLLDDLSDHNLKYRHGYPHHFYYHR